MTLKKLWKVGNLKQKFNDFCLETALRVRPWNISCHQISSMSQRNSIHTNLNRLEAGLSPLVQGSEGTLQGPPGDTLTTACLAHQHGGVSRAFSLIKLDDFGHGKRSHLQTAPMKLPLYNLLQLQQNEFQSVNINIQKILIRCCILSMLYNKPQ